MKISRLEKALDLMDTMGSPDSGRAATKQVREMLQGLDWIDNQRAIVVLADQSGDRPFSAMLIPFSRANPNFRKAYNASRRNGYYLISLPPGSGTAITENMEMEMAAASSQPAAATITMAVALRRVLDSNRERIDGMRRSLDQMRSPQQNEGLTMSPEEIEQMVAGLLDAVEQVDTLNFSLDLNEQQFKAVMETVPVTGSELSSFFTGSSVTTRLDDYRPAHDITFRSRSYRVDSLLDMLDRVVGPVYRKLGIDFGELVSIGRNFTGETAGGMSYGDGANVMFESLAVLKKEVDTENFLETVYLPWIEAYGRSIGRMVEKNTGTRATSVLTRAPDSTVEGHRVIGMRIKIPLSPMPFDGSRKTSRDTFMTYNTRTAVTGNLMMVAPDDRRLGEMIRMADKLKKKTSHGPLMSFEVDMGRYLASLARLIPGHNIDPNSIPDFGKLTARISTGSGRVISSTAMETDDIRLMIAYLAGMKGGSGSPGIEPAPSAPKRTEAPEPVVRDAGYWSDRGRLAATYGAYESAIVHYKKALAMGAEEGRANFNMGVAYGEMGDYPAALAHMKKAIRSDPDNGAFYYGRGRVYLLAGDRDAAMLDFDHAAVLGDRDAQQYLEAR